MLPGIGPIAGIAILLPLTFKLDATGAIIMLSAIYYGAMYGGTITSVLMNVPGEGASAVTAIDGYQMAKHGPRRRGARHRRDRLLHRRHGRDHRARRRGAAARRGRAEIRAAGILRADAARARSCSSAFRATPSLPGFISALLGLALSIPGTDFVEGTPRLTFGILDLLDGIGFVPVIMGLYGIGEILASLDRRRAPIETADDRLDDARRARSSRRLGDADRARHRASASSSA